MLSIPAMVMIGGNSRNSGKTTMACNIISKISSSIEVIGLKVTSVRPGEEDKHGKHNEEIGTDYTIFEEFDCESHKDTSKMLRAGASHVYYIRVSDNFVEQALLHFLSRYINKQVIVCESRSLRNIICPGLFLMMVRNPVQSEEKDVEAYLSKADKIFYFDGESNAESTEKRQFVADLNFGNGKFILK